MKEIHMKFKMIAFILSLSILSWAQTATQSKPNQATPPTSSAAQADNKAECPCCQKTAESKEAMACCAHHEMAANDGEKPMPCCAGKDAKSCMEDKEGKSCMQGDKSQTASCGGSGCCGADHEKCCSKSEKDGEKAAMGCCAKCGQHQHDHSAAAGN
jgi:hypothetical protein